MGRSLSRTVSTRALSSAIWSAVYAKGSAIFIGHAESAARRMPVDIVIRAKHPGGSALDAVLIGNDDLFERLVPVVHAGGARGDAGLAHAAQAHLRIHDFNMSLV